MITRLLKGFAGNLYDSDSEAHHRSLERLAVVLDQLGYRVRKKAEREATLRVYLRQDQRYPLLNPRFERTAADLDAALDRECVVVTVLSKHENGSLQRHLEAYPAADHSRFVPNGVAKFGYFCHGYFVVSLAFSGTEGSEDIEFDHLAIPFRAILAHMRRRT